MYAVMILLSITLLVLVLCVAGMAVGVMVGRKPIQHCGNASLKHKGQDIDCPLCANKECPENKKGACGKGAEAAG